MLVSQMPHSDTIAIIVHSMHLEFDQNRKATDKTGLSSRENEEIRKGGGHTETSSFSLW